MIPHDEDDEPNRYRVPRDHNAERMVLAGVMAHPEAYAEAASLLRRDDFPYDPERAIWDAITEQSREGEPIIASAILRRLERTKVSINPDYFLALATAPITAGTVGYHCEEMLAASELRLIAALHGELGVELNNPAAQPATLRRLITDKLEEARLRSVPGTARLPTGGRWPDPLELDNSPAPPLDALLLGGIGEMAQSVSTALQVPVDLPALLGLAVASAAIGGRRLVSPKPDWNEVITLYTMPVAAPGEMKSPALALMAGPLYRAQTSRRKTAEEKITKDAKDRHLAEARIKGAEAKFIKAFDPPAMERAKAQMQLAQKELEMLGDAPVMPQLIADDTTPEALADIMLEQDDRMAILSTEGSFLGNVAGRYASGNANPEIVLKGWNQEPHPINRKGRSVLLENPNLTLGLAAQPGLLTGLGKSAAVFEERGLMGRFLFGMPDSRVGSRTYDSEKISDDVKDAYEASIKAMVTQLWADKKRLTLELDEKSADSFRSFWIDLEPRHAADGDLSSVEGWAKKLPGQVLRIASVLELFAEPASLTVGGRAMDDAIAMVPYLVAHARLVADLMSGQRRSSLGPARDIREWLRSTRTEVFAVADAQRALRGRAWCGSVEDVDAAVAVLEERSWVAQLPQPERAPGTRGRPPKSRFAVHPSLWSGE